MMGIRGKLLAPLVVLGLSFAAILHLYWYPQFLATETIALQQRELATMEVIATTLTPSLLAGDLAQMHRSLDQLLGHQIGWKTIHLKAADGRYLYPITPSPASRQVNADDWLTYPIEFDGEQIAMLEVSINIKALLSSQLEQIKNLETLLLLLLLGIIVLAALFQDRWVRSPLKALVDATSRIASGNFKLVLPEATSQDEIGRLITSFDTMRINLENRENKLARQHALLETIHTAQAGFISDTDARDLFKKLLEDILALTDSEHGFIGEIHYRDSKPCLQTFAISNIAWSDEVRQFHDKHDSDGMEFTNMQSLYGAVITGNEPVIVNNPAGDSRAIDMPDSDPPLNAFLGIPFLRDGKAIGMVGIANRPGGYDKTLLELLKPVISTCGHIVEALKADRQRIQAEKQVREREVRMRTIFENVVDGIVTSTATGHIESFNNAAENMFGYSADEVIGHNASILIPSLSEERHDRYIEKQLMHDKGRKHGFEQELVGRRKDGTTFPLDVTVTLMWVGNDKYYCSIMRDITERKKIDRIKNEFVSTVSHELRTPLTSIRGSLGLLSGGAAGELPQQARSLLEIAGNNTERLLLLINDILDIEKIESGQISFRFKNVAVKEFLEQSLQANENYASQHNIRLKLSDTGGDQRIYADPDRLMQVMNNILSNAVKFSPEGATVEVTSSCREGTIRISITDHGTGIAEEFQSRLFDKFTQSDASDTRKIGGTGLGMNITRAIVEKHGGKIDFVTRQGIGTTFYFEMPVMLDLSDSNELYEITASMDHADNHVLIVEDDPDVASLLRIMLAQAGFNSDIALDAQQAKQRLSENHYTAVTMDIMLPDQDGISLIKELRQQDATKDLPIIVVSAKADVVKRELSGGALSVVDWLNKPIDQGRLLSTINQLTGPRNFPVVLHVEDEPDVHVIVSTLLKDTARVVWARTLQSAREQLENNSFDLALLDIGLPDGSAIQLLDTLNQHSPPIPTVMFSAQDVDETLAQRVSAALVKSTASNKDLVDTIKSLLSRPDTGNVDIFPEIEAKEANSK